MRLHRHLASILLAGALALPISAQAGEPSAGEIAVARKRFTEANELEKDKKWSEAEAKLREAMSIKETAGLRYHLGFVLEQQNKFVEALLEYERAEEMIAHGAKAPDVAELVGPARERVRKRIANLTIKIPSDITDPKIEVDGSAIKAALYGKPLPLNPGNHVVTASASGRQAFRVEVSLSEGESDDVAVNLPKRGEAAGAAAAATPAAAPHATNAAGSQPEHHDEGATASTSGSGSPILGYALVGVGGAALVVGGVFAYLAKKQLDDAENDPALCPEKTCSPAGREQVNSADRKRTVSTIALATGVIAVGAGVVLILTSGSKETQAAHHRSGPTHFWPSADLHADTHGGRFVLSGAF